MTPMEPSSCRACAGSLTSVLDLGQLRLSDFPQGPIDGRRFPLNLCSCNSCKLVQLSHSIEPDALFRHYWYRSGVNETMRSELQDIVRHAKATTSVAKGDVALDIGANDGTLLSFLSGVQRIAYEPAENLKPFLRQHSDIICPDYFPGREPKFDLRPRLTGQIKLIFSIACFYAVERPAEFVRAIDNLLHPDGVWIVQFQDLHQMLASSAFDDICHEHVFYPSLASVERLLVPFDLAIFDAQQREINGGSLRLLIGRRSRTPSPNVARLRLEEAGCESIDRLKAFAVAVSDVRARIRSAVANATASRLTIDLYGASTKGNTLLQICGLGPDLIRQAWERSESKWGRKTITGIPIVGEDAGRKDPPDLLLVIIWQFRDAVIQREADFLENGGRLLFPLPSVEIVSRPASADALRA